MLGHSDNGLQEQFKNTKANVFGEEPGNEELKSSISSEESMLQESNIDGNPEGLPIMGQAPQVHRENNGQHQEDPVKAHIRQILQNQNLANQMTTGQQEEAQREQERQARENQGENDEEQQEQVREQVRAQVQKQLQDIKLELNKLSRGATIVKQQKRFQHVKPDFRNMYLAYQKTGFEYTDSGEKRYKLLVEAEKRAELQKNLEKKLGQNRNANAARQNVTLEKAVSLTDQYLVEHLGEFQGVGTGYIKIRYNLMKNPYYSLLPAQELKKSRYEILKKLNSEYKREPQDVALITFYQDIIKLRVVENAEANKKSRKEPENLPTEITEKERKSNKSYRVKLVDQIYKNIAISKEEKIKRGQAMSMVMDDLTTHLWDDVHKPASEKRNVTDQKREGVRQILAWMYRNCKTDRGSMEPFIYKLTQAKPDQLLHMFYMIEYDLWNTPNAECYHSAVTGYVPDLKIFSKKTNWNRLSDVAKFVFECDQIEEYMQLENQEEELKDKLAPNNPMPLSEDEEEDAKFELIKVRYNKLINMYKTAGLEPGMSIDLVEDPKLKERIRQSASEFAQSIANLADEQIVRLDREVNAGEKTEKKISAKNKEKKAGMSNDEIISDVKTYAGAGLEIKSVFKAIGEKAKDIVNHGAYIGVTNGLSEVLSLVGLITSVKAAWKLSDSAGLISKTDYTVKAMRTYTNIVKSGSGIMSGAAQFVKYANGTQVKFAPQWIGKTSITPISESCKTVTGAIQFGAGVISIGAGTVQMIAGNMERKQAVRSKQHLEQAKNALDQYAAQTRLELNEQERIKREQKKQQLKDMMVHRGKMVDVQKTSSTVKMIGAGITIFGGFLSTTGLLAPIGGIISIIGTGLNLFIGMRWARKKKNAAINQAVDEGLKLDQAVAKVKQHFGLNNLTEKQEQQLRDQVRSEALAELNYTTSKSCYYGTMKQYAEIIYSNVLEHPAERTSNEYKMFYEMLLSLKFDKKDIKRAVKPHERHKPSIAMIYSRLTEG